MRTARAMIGFLVLGIFACAGPTSTLAPGNADPVLREALCAWGLTVADLAIPVDHLADPLRLEATRRVLGAPAGAPDLASSMVADLEGSGAEAALSMARRHLGLEPVDHVKGKVVRADLAPLAGLDSALTTLLVPLLDELDLGLRQVEAERRRFSPVEQAEIRRLLDIVDPDCGVPEREVDSLLALAGRLDGGVMASAAARLLRAGNRFASLAKDLPVRAWPPVGKATAFDTPAGRVMVGGVGEDTYLEPAVLIVDPGGDDRYEADARDGAHSPAVSLCIDLGGADVHAGTLGSGLFGVGVLLDLAGNDVYGGRQGAGVAGVGILEDRGGDDSYRAGLGGQGFGLFGIGVLCDLAGSDRYSGDLLVQGAAGPGGCGLLCDGGGDDRYQAGGRYADFREEGVHLSMAQGFSRGIRPLASGGMALLLDAGGNDTYEAEYFAQGSSFWGGMGVLIDGAGRDRYEARRYAQGCGSHMAVGVLLDREGDDRYALWGVGQGCGHDLSLGALIDGGGNDVYQAVWLAQGVGNANGVGVLDEAMGDDRYSAVRDDTQGYGGSYRDHGSIGLLLDRAGADQYEGAGEDGGLWTGGMCGTGIDVTDARHQIRP